MSREKVKIYIEHPDGYHETISVTTPIAIPLILRLLERGYPWCSATVNDIRIKEQGYASNVFVGYYGEKVIL